jgi:uncharacterized protein with PIN domain
MPGSPSAAPRFLADVMLGRLARWLRYLGYDTAYERTGEDADLVRRAQGEGRVLLTRDRGILRRWPSAGGLLVEGDRSLDQLRRVVDRFGLTRLPPRCTVCNGALTDLPRERAASRVPPYVARTQEPFRACATCGRVYWDGTHARRMSRLLEEALG